MFAGLDDYLWQLTYKWACAATPGNRSAGSSGGTSAGSTPPGATTGSSATAASGACLPRLAWTPIIRHRKVTGRASPDDPALTAYWNQRRGTNQAPLDRSTLRLLNMQRGRCALCADLLLHADREPHIPGEWQRWHRTTRKAITRQIIAREPGMPDTTRLDTHLLPAPGNPREQPGTGIFTHLNRPPGLA